MSYFNRDSRSGGRRDFGGRRSFGNRGGRGDREMFSAVCSECGKECQVPFQPTGSKPVYCSECFEKKGGGSKRPQNNTQLEAISAKLDKILAILEPKEIEIQPEKPIVVFEKKAEKKTKKAKKEASVPEPTPVPTPEE
jgi:CxxC-x17-CxxC domain-containing protein